MKKLFALLLAMVMVFSLATVAFANNEPTTTTFPSNDDSNKGTITIKDVAVYYDEEHKTHHTVAKYSVYKILEIASYNETDNNYTYIVTDSRWETFFTTNEVAKKYYNVAANGYVTWNDKTSVEPTVAAAEVAPEALAFAKEKGIEPTSNDYEFTGAVTSTAKVADIKFTELDLGYYLVDSSMGILCGLTTASPNAEATAKNVPPTVEKKVQEDSQIHDDNSSWGKTNTADIGQPVNFDITIEVRSGAQNYAIHDTLPAGMTMNFNSIVVKYFPEAGGSETLEKGADKDYIVHSIVQGTEGTRTCMCGNNKPEHLGAITCSFEVEFTESLCKSLITNDQLTLTYSATLNASAVSGSTGNVNKTHVTFGEGHETEEATTTTYTYNVDLVKTDGDGKLLKGAQFKLYPTLTGGDPLKLVLTNPYPGESAPADYIPEYRLYYEGFDNLSDVQVVDVVHGQAKFIGLDRGSYYLEETLAPEGYNLLTSRHRVEITDANLEAKFDGDGKLTTGSTAVQVQNSAGAKLPETGAMGTTMFITFGMFVVLGTGILLVTKKRMSMIED